MKEILKKQWKFIVHVMKRYFLDRAYTSIWLSLGYVSTNHGSAATSLMRHELELWYLVAKKKLEDDLSA